MHSRLRVDVDGTFMSFLWQQEASLMLMGYRARLDKDSTSIALPDTLQEDLKALEKKVANAHVP